jgi:hypothetical protein
MLFSKTVQTCHCESNLETWPSNYRPISQILERINLRRLNIFISGHNVLPNHKFGIRAAHSTSHQLNRVAGHVKNRRVVYWDASFGRGKGF